LQLDASGRTTRSIDLQSLGTYGPNGLAVDAQGNIYLADTGGNRIMEFATAGGLVRTIGAPGAELGQLKQPMALSFGPDGAMFVTDFENNRLERWDASLRATNAWPLLGHSWGVAVDRLSRVFVPDADHNVVRMYSA
jgi:sugar lactone lactonase YvrE